MSVVSKHGLEDHYVAVLNHSADAGQIQTS